MEPEPLLGLLAEPIDADGGIDVAVEFLDMMLARRGREDAVEGVDILRILRADATAIHHAISQAARSERFDVTGDGLGTMLNLAHKAILHNICELAKRVEGGGVVDALNPGVCIEGGELCSRLAVESSH